MRFEVFLKCQSRNLKINQHDSMTVTYIKDPSTVIHEWEFQVNLIHFKNTTFQVRFKRIVPREI